MSAEVFPSRRAAEAVRRTLHVTAADIKVRRVSADTGPHGHAGWIIERRDWATTGPGLYWQGDGWGGYEEER